MDPPAGQGPLAWSSDGSEDVGVNAMALVVVVTLGAVHKSGNIQQFAAFARTRVCDADGLLLIGSRQSGSAVTVLE